MLMKFTYPALQAASGAILACFVCSQALSPALADDGVSTRRVVVESSTKVEKIGEPGVAASSYSRGVGFKDANVFNPKYKERLKNFQEQLDMGLAKGWITDKEGAQFKARLEALKEIEKKVSAAKYPKADLDDMEKQFTLYNQDFYKASNKPASKPKAASEKQKEATGTPATLKKPKEKAK